jgi:hypothetical protein
LYFESVFEGSRVPKRLAYRKKASLSTTSFGNPNHRCKFGLGATLANNRLQPSRTNDADEEGDTEEGGNDEAYKAQDVHP